MENTEQEVRTKHRHSFVAVQGLRVEEGGIVYVQSPMFLEDSLFVCRTCSEAVPGSQLLYWLTRGSGCIQMPVALVKAWQAKYKTR